MSETDNSNDKTTTPVGPADSTSGSGLKLTGRVKWFNNKTGFGFITALTDSEGIKEGSDVFVHHSAVKVSQEQYRYLVQGEYVEFVLSKLTASSAADASASKHEFQAVDVSGVKGGKLICETRWENRSIGSGSTGSGSGPESGSSRFKRDESQDGWNYVGAASNRSFVPRQGSTEWRSSSGRGRGYSRGGASTGPASSSE